MEILAHRYELVRLLSRGGMGAVFEAIDHTVGRRVAIKTLHPHLVEEPGHCERFRREAFSAAALAHPHIVQTTDYGVDAARGPFLVLELLIGETLADRIRRDGALSPEESVFIAHQILDALSAAHGVGIVHRDIKPSNLFLTRMAGVDNVAKVLDFGVAKLYESRVWQRLTQTGQVIGTPSYMAPEQALGQDVDARADLYAVGLVLYAMLAGRPAYSPGGPELVVDILSGNHVPIREAADAVDPELARVVERAVSVRREERFVDAAAMAAALAPWLPSCVQALHLARTPTPPVRESDALHNPRPSVPVEVALHVENSEPPVAAASRPSRRVLVSVGVVLGLSLTLAASLSFQRLHTPGVTTAQPQQGALHPEPVNDVRDDATVGRVAPVASSSDRDRPPAETTVVPSTERLGVPPVEPRPDPYAVPSISAHRRPRNTSREADAHGHDSTPVVTPSPGAHRSSRSPREAQPRAPESSLGVLLTTAHATYHEQADRWERLASNLDELLPSVERVRHGLRRAAEGRTPDFCGHALVAVPAGTEPVVVRMIDLLRQTADQVCDVARRSGGVPSYDGSDGAESSSPETRELESRLDTVASTVRELASNYRMTALRLRAVSDQVR